MRTLRLQELQATGGTSLAGGTSIGTVNSGRHQRAKELLVEKPFTPWLNPGDVVTNSPADTVSSIHKLIEYTKKEFATRIKSAASSAMGDVGVIAMYNSLDISPGWLQFVISGPAGFREYTIVGCFNLLTIATVIQYGLGKNRNRDISWALDGSGLGKVCTSQEVGDATAEAKVGEATGFLTNFPITIDKPNRDVNTASMGQDNVGSGCADMELYFHHPEKSGVPAPVLKEGLAELVGELQKVIKPLKINDLPTSGQHRTIVCHQCVVDHGLAELKALEQVIGCFQFILPIFPPPHSPSSLLLLRSCLRCYSTER